MTRPLKLTIPDPLAAEVRRIAKLTRRPQREVIDAALGGLFDEISEDDVRQRFMERLRGEIMEHDDGK